MKHIFIIIILATGLTLGQNNYKLYRGGTDTVTTVPDTIAHQILGSAYTNVYGQSDFTNMGAFAYWYVSIVADDTAEVSTTSTFSTGTVAILLPNFPLGVGPMQLTSNKNLFIRRYNVSGETGTPRYYFTFYGY